jgi:hypothetical protein
MEHIQNATIAGGVAIGAVCNFLQNPWGAMVTGVVAGTVSTYGFSFLSPVLKRNGLTDTCGIVNLHLMPGLIGGAASAIAAGTINIINMNNAPFDPANYPLGSNFITRSPLVQGGFQFAATAISFFLAIFCGVIVGFLIRLPFASPMTDSFYEDAGAWNVPFDEETDTELRDDVVQQIEAAKYEIYQQLIREIAAAGVAVKPTLVQPVAVPMPAELRSRPLFSANERFLEGSVRGGRRPGDGSVKGGSHYEGSVHNPAKVNNKVIAAMQLNRVGGSVIAPPAPTASGDIVNAINQNRAGWP